MSRSIGDPDYKSFVPGAKLEAFFLWPEGHDQVTPCPSVTCTVDAKSVWNAAITSYDLVLYCIAFYITLHLTRIYVALCCTSYISHYIEHHITLPLSHTPLLSSLSFSLMTSPLPSSLLSPLLPSPTLFSPPPSLSSPSLPSYPLLYSSLSSFLSVPLPSSMLCRCLWVTS